MKGINRPVPAGVLLFGTMTSPLAMFPSAQVSFKSLRRSAWTSEARIPVSSETNSSGRRAGDRLALAAAMSFTSSPATDGPAYVVTLRQGPYAVCYWPP